MKMWLYGVCYRFSAKRADAWFSAAMRTLGDKVRAQAVCDSKEIIKLTARCDEELEMGRWWADKAASLHVKMSGARK